MPHRVETWNQQCQRLAASGRPEFVEVVTLLQEGTTEDD
jgi:hypothetical protein